MSLGLANVDNARITQACKFVHNIRRYLFGIAGCKLPTLIMISSLHPITDDVATNAKKENPQLKIYLIEAACLP